jgi:hypothetical protein
VSPVRYELGSYIPEDDILHSHRRENLESYIFNMHQRLNRIAEYHFFLAETVYLCFHHTTFCDKTEF